MYFLMIYNAFVQFKFGLDRRFSVSKEKVIYETLNNKI